MKYTPGLMVGQLSGKAGSTVASRNRGGSYFRTRVIPKLVRNARTTAVRESFTENSQAYRLLTDAQRQAWASLGSQVVVKNSLGESIHLTGLQMYQRVNQNLATIELPPISDAPAQVTGGGLGNAVLSAVAGAAGTTTVTVGATSATQQVGSTANMFVGATLHFVTAGVFRTVVTIPDATHVVVDSPLTTTTAETINWTRQPTVELAWDATLGPDDYLVVFFTPPLSAGISRPSKSAFRLVGLRGTGDTSPDDMGHIYAVTLGQPEAGQKIFARAFCVNQVTGLSGPQVEVVATVS